MEFKQVAYKTKICELSDFGDDEAAKEQFDAWKAFTLICPETEALDKLQFLGDRGSFISSHVKIRFQHCKDKPICKTKQQIIDYIKDI